MGVFSHMPTGSGSFYPYKIDQSCRFNSVDTAKTTRAGTASANYDITFSTWVKRAVLGTYQFIVGSGTDANNWCGLYFTNTDKIRFYQIDSSVVECNVQTNAYFRDVSSWYHIVFYIDGDNASQSQRFRLYINGVLYNSTSGLDITTSLAQNTEFKIHYWTQGIGIRSYDDANPADLYLAETILVSDTALAPEYFGQTKNGVWVPKRYKGSYGAAGYYLDYSNSADFGEDQSGNGNDFTDSGLAAADQVEDSPTNNFPIGNILDNLDVDFVATDWANGGLEYSTTTNNSNITFMTMAIPDTGKWYFEFKATGTSAVTGFYLGVRCGRTSPTGSGLAYYAADGQGYVSAWGAYGSAWSDNDIIGVLVNRDDDEVTFYLNNVSQGALSTSLNGPAWIALGTTNIGEGGLFDFGQSGFTYTPPAGAKAVCSANLPAPLIVEGNKGFDVVTYTGTGAAQSITDLEFSPDLVWIKNRDQADEYKVLDSVRGATEELSSDSTNIEATDANGLTAFDANGFTLGTGADGYNDNTENFVSWCWREDPRYGFDIVSYTGTGVARTVSHSLGVMPEMIIVKNRDDVQSWPVYHRALNGGTTPEQYVMYLDLTDAETVSAVKWNDTAPTSSVFTVGTADDTNGSGEELIAYLFASVEGFSKVFFYTGNASVDGPFVYCGFRPRYILLKNVDNTTDWIVKDTDRDTYNLASKYLVTNETDAEGDPGASMDILSNGFKLLNTGATSNGSGESIVGIAFAEHPFKYANAR